MKTIKVMILCLLLAGCATTGKPYVEPLADSAPDEISRIDYCNRNPTRPTCLDPNRKVFTAPTPETAK